MATQAPVRVHRGLQPFNALAFCNDVMGLHGSLWWFPGMHSPTGNRKKDKAIKQLYSTEAREHAERIQAQLAGGQIHLLDCSKTIRHNIKPLWEHIENIIVNYGLLAPPPKNPHLPTVKRSDWELLFEVVGRFAETVGLLRHTQGRFITWDERDRANLPAVVSPHYRERVDWGGTCQYDFVGEREADLLRRIAKCRHCGDTICTFITEPEMLGRVFRKCGESSETKTEDNDQDFRAQSRKRSKGTVNARMLETLQKNSESRGWTCTRWSKLLKCAKSTVVETATWKVLAMARKKISAERAMDRHRKTMGR